MTSGFVIAGCVVLFMGWFCIYISIRMRKSSHKSDDSNETQMNRYENGDFDDLDSGDSSEEEQPRR